MKASAPTVTSIDQYIAGFPREVQTRLAAMRSTIQRAAPQATEKISYRIPTFYLNGNLVHFAAFKNHIGFFPTGKGVSAFEKELSGYKHAKGSIQFPMDKPLPLQLIRRIVQLRVKQNNQPKTSTAKLQA
jgi:uncharacterized protein YdhG (YjbR/CyaY superfamily)